MHFRPLTYKRSIRLSTIAVRSSNTKSYSISSVMEWRHAPVFKLHPVRLLQSRCLCT